MGSSYRFEINFGPTESQWGMCAKCQHSGFRVEGGADKIFCEAGPNPRARVTECSVFRAKTSTFPRPPVGIREDALYLVRGAKKSIKWLNYEEMLAKSPFDMLR